MQLLVRLPEVESNVEDSEGNTPAHLAAAEGHLDCLRLLVYHKRQPMDALIARNNEVRLNQAETLIILRQSIT